MLKALRPAPGSANARRPRRPPRLSGARDGDGGSPQDEGTPRTRPTSALPEMQPKEPGVAFKRQDSALRWW